MLSTQVIHAFFQQFGLETIEENVLLFMRLQSCLIYLTLNIEAVGAKRDRLTLNKNILMLTSSRRNEFANSSKKSAKSKKLLWPLAGRCKPEIDFPSHPSFALPGAACLIGSHAYEWGHQEFGYPVKKREETKSNFWPDLEVFTHSYYDDPKTIDSVNLTNAPVHAEQQWQRMQQLSSFQRKNTGHLDPSAAEFSQIGQQSHPHKIISTESLPFIFAKVHNMVFNASLSSKLLPGAIGQSSVRPSRNLISLAPLHGARVSRVTNSLGDSNISGAVPPASGNAGVAPKTQSSMINATGVYLSPTGTPVPQTSPYAQGQAPLGNQPYFHPPANQGSANDAAQGFSCSPDNPTFRTHISLKEIENARRSEVGSSQTITMSTKRDSPSSSMIATPQTTVATSECVQVSSSGESTLPSSKLLNHGNSRSHSLSKCSPLASSPPQNRIDVGDPHSTAGSQGTVSRVSTESSAMDPATVAPFTTQNRSRLGSFAGGASSAGFTNSANSTTSNRPYGSDIGSSNLLPLTSKQMSLHQDISVNRELNALPTLSQGTSSLTSSLDARYTTTFDTAQTCAMTFIIDQSQCEAFSRGDPAVTELLRAQAAARVKNAREQAQNQAQDESQKKKQQEQQRPPPAQPGRPQQIGHTTCNLAQCFPAPVTPGAIDIQRPETLHRSPGSTKTVAKALEISAPRSSAQTTNQHQVTEMPENHLDHPQLELRAFPDGNGNAPHGKVTVFRVNPVTSEGTTGAQSAQNHRQEMPGQRRAQETQVQIQQLQVQQIQPPQLQGGTRGQAQNLHVQSNALVLNPQTVQPRYVQNLGTQQWSPVAPSLQWTGSHAQNHIISQAIVPQSMAPQWTGSQAQAPMMSQWAGSHVQNVIIPQSMTSQSMPPPSMPPLPMTPQSIAPQSMPLQSMPLQSMPPQPMTPQSMPPPSMAPQSMISQPMPPQSMPPPSMTSQPMTPHL
ncbi:hypothetical protein Cpir12675_006395 [Ceratocystis pirilliformis]|uniref:LsmAD domain-containing protein n=1 Tax=Ceratocystis pirilliformis TaxID=259994 RepID=A0ABR3YJ26_9PEZI